MVQVSSLVTTIVGGLGVLTSYGVVFGKLIPGQSYATHPFWLGLDKNFVSFLIMLQVLAVFGFITSVGTWILDPPEGGILSSSSRAWLLPLTLAVFLASATIWAPATFYKLKWLAVFSLITTATSSILLLAGSVEEDVPRWWVVLGLLFLNIVTVLADGVIWNARYIVT